MKFSSSITGSKAFATAMEKFSDKTERNLAKNIKEITLEVHRFAVMSIQNNSDGTPSVRYNPKRKVKVSRPGTPPNTDTGTLAKSVAFEFLFESGKFTGRVGTNLKYGAYLEFGTLTMRARPWLRPALKTQQKFFVNRFQNDIKKIAREVARQKRAKGGTE